MKYSDKKPLACMMTQSTCYRGTYAFQPRGILWHCTGANNPNLWRYVQPSNSDPDRDELLRKIGKNNYGSDWNHQTVYAGVNAFIGKLADGSVETIQTMPWNYAPWGCAGGAKGSANNTHIQFEICEDALTDKTYFDRCYKEAVELTAYLCKLYGINPKGMTRVGAATVPTILCHYDAFQYGVGSGHYDVYNWFNKFGKTMDDVRNDVAALIKSDGVDPQKKDGFIRYRAHVQTYGWMPAVADGEVAGTTGQSKRLEAIKITPPEGVELEVIAHIQTYGNKKYTGIVKGKSSGISSSDNDPIIGTVGQKKRLEALTIRCAKNTTGKRLKYQAHCRGIGWQDPVNEGEMCGTIGQSRRMEAIKIWFE